MSIDLEVYLKRRPDLRKPIQSFQLEPIQQRDPLLDYFRLFKPNDRQENEHWIEVKVPIKPKILELEEITEIYPTLFQGERPSSERFINKIRSEGLLRADPDTYNLFQENPHFENDMPELDRFWRVLKLAGGQPTYQVQVETPIWVPQRTIVTMYSLAGSLAQEYDGVIWDPRTGKAGLPDPRAGYDSAKNFFGRVSGTMELKGYSVDKEFPDN